MSDQKLVCPKCGSNYIRHNLVHIPLLDGEHLFTCGQCGERFGGAGDDAVAAEEEETS